MQLVLHAGAHFTEEERLVRCLLRNKEDFSRRGIAVPGPSKYRTILRETLAAMQDHAPVPDARDVLLDMILDDEAADRMILSHLFLFGAPRACVRGGMMYDGAPQRLRQLASLFPDDRIELFLAMRNPATFLPSLLTAAPQHDMNSFLRGANPFEIRWSNTFSAIRSEVPEVTITTWCFEDMPLLWAEIIRAMAGLEPGEKIIGGFDLLSDIMSPEGMQQFRAYLKTHPTMSDVQKRRVMSEFLSRYVIEEAIEEELVAPGWTDATIETLTTIYDEDMSSVARIPGVRFIAP